MSFKEKRLTHASAVLIPFLGILGFGSSGPSLGADVVHACDARTYKRCSSFLASVAPSVERSRRVLGGYSRSKGSWTITVGYEPAESCAIVKLLVDRGPLEPYGQYERVLIGGGGTISDGGEFVHKTGELESALGIDSKSCFVPDRPHSTGFNPPPPPEDVDRALRALASGDQVDQKRLYEKARARVQERKVAVETRRLEEERRTKREEEFHKFLRRLNARVTREREEREERERMERQRATGDAIQTFLGVLGTAIEMRQGRSGGSGSSGSIQSPSSQEPRSRPRVQWCRTPHGRCGVIVEGKCVYYDVVGGCR